MNRASCSRRARPARHRCSFGARYADVRQADNTDTVALGRFHRCKFAFCDTGYNAPDRDGAVLLVDIVPAQTHDLLAADTGVQQNGNRCAERTVKMRDNVCKLLGLVDFVSGLILMPSHGFRLHRPLITALFMIWSMVMKM